MNTMRILTASDVAVQNLEEFYTPMSFGRRGVDMSETDGCGMAP